MPLCMHGCLWVPMLRSDVCHVLMYGCYATHVGNMYIYMYMYMYMYMHMYMYMYMYIYILGSAPPINGSKRGFVYITQPKMSTRKSNLLPWVHVIQNRDTWSRWGHANVGICDQMWSKVETFVAERPKPVSDVCRGVIQNSRKSVPKACGMWPDVSRSILCVRTQETWDVWCMRWDLEKLHGRNGKTFKRKSQTYLNTFW